MKIKLTLLLCFFFTYLLSAQIIWTDPVFPKPSSPVTVFFDATQGTGGLANCNCDVYIHTGVITSASTGPSDWKHVPTTWGVANAAWKMTPVAGQPNIYSYLISPSIKAFYSVTDPNEVIEQLAMVFRNADGSKEGKDIGGADIFYDVYPDNLPFSAFLLSPSVSSIFAQSGEVIEVEGASSEPATLTLKDNGNLLTSTTGTALDFNITVSGSGTHVVEFAADNGSQVLTQSFTYLVPLPVQTQALPAGADLGINYLSDTEVLFALYAPQKQHIFLVGDFNDWVPSTDYQLKRTPDGTTWWIQISGLTPGEYYAFQYIVDGEIRIADPYSELILDPFNDGFVPPLTFPNIPPYPTGKTNGNASLIQPGAPEYDWQVNDFQRPAQENLVVYEMLLRDFVNRHDFQTLRDTLDYLERLGVTAIELMPVNEFDGNVSWGYNPTFHAALDKYYGSPEAFKMLVDECHARGIAVILDVVFNHAHERSPLAMLYWDAVNFRPAANNPWLNVMPTHDFNVFSDFNHESQATKTFTKKCLQYWLEEYRVDGFRFDLSKGFTQKVTIGNSGAMAQYDAGRVAIWKDYADFIWDLEEDAYVILEHFADNAEEKELANYGMMLWGNGNCQFNQATMGYPNAPPCTWDFGWSINYKARGWDNPHIVSYMESHDEERLMNKNLQFGNSSGSYSTKDLATALDRMEQANVFFYAVPGAKMIWQFGEVGYDYSINHCVNGTVSNNCRLDPKPIRWDYIGQPNRTDVYNVVRSMLHLRNTYDVFQTTDFEVNVAQNPKTVHLNDNDMNVAVLGNFAVQAASVIPHFQHTGWWYEYFSGDSLNVANTAATLNLEAGEYRLYTDVKLAKLPEYVDAEEEFAGGVKWQIAPNPAASEANILVELPENQFIRLAILDGQGRLVASIFEEKLPGGLHSFTVPEGLTAGIYVVQLVVEGKVEVRKLLKN